MARTMLGVWAALLLGGSAILAQEPIAAPRPDFYLPPPACCAGEGASHESFWATFDYLVGWVEGARLAPLVTTSPVGTPRATAGVLGLPTTQILFDGRVSDEVRSGFRLGAGYWFGPELGIEGGFSMLESQSTLFSANSDATPILARPFTNVLTGTQQAVLVAFPGSSTGTIDIRAHSGNLYEGHIDLTEKVLDTDWLRLVAIFGYRFYRYDEDLRINQSLFPTGPAFIPGTSVVTTDDFGAQNTFHGLDLGWRAKFLWSRLSADLLGKIAVGNVNRTVNIMGAQTTTVPGAAPLNATGGVLALSSNIGRHESSDWTIFPELGVTLGWQVRSNLWVRVGYTALFLSQIARASDQIDVGLNPNLFPPVVAPAAGPNRPAFGLQPTDIWIHSLTFGLELTF